MVVPVVPARMEKTAVLALGHLARAPRGTARIYFTVHARRSLARCPQPVAAVLVADLAALHSLARPTRARLRLSDRPPLLLPTSAHWYLSHTRPSLPADRPPLLLPPLTGVPRSPVPSPYSAVLSRLVPTQPPLACLSRRTNSTSARVLRAKLRPGWLARPRDYYPLNAPSRRGGLTLQSKLRKTVYSFPFVRVESDRCAPRLGATGRGGVSRRARY